MNDSFLYNVNAFISVILDNNSEKLKDIDILFIETVYKDGNKTSVDIKKEDLNRVIIDIFGKDDISLVKEVNINYLQDGLVVNLNGINVF